MLRAAGVDPEAPRIQLLLELAGQVQGLPRHLGQHTGGLVIAAGRLDEVVPIEPAAMPGRRVIQWDKDDCADLGLIKIDLLGLGMLDALEQTLPLIRAHEGVTIDLAHLPPDDPKTYGMIQRADTVGVFQIESRAQMATLPRMKPANFYDLVVEIAIIRPGPIVGQMVHPYLNRRAGREPVAYPHPSLEPILARTLGVPIFQEQLLRVAMVAAGFTGGEAEELRRAMGFKRSVERMEQIEARLRSGMTERGILGAAQDEIVRGITSFALYGFPESHSASFALIAYASAYLRAHHPAAFLAGMLNALPLGFYSPATLVKDAQRHGVVVLPIDVTQSEWRCTLEGGGGSGRGHASAPWLARSHTVKGDVSCCALLPLQRAPGPPRKPSVRVGLRYVRGLSADTGERLVGVREAAAFSSLADFAARVAPKRNEIEALAEAGALAGIDARAAKRRSALWQVGALERDPRSLFAGVSPPGADAESPLDELDALETTLADYRSTGLTTGPHVMAHLRAGLARARRAHDARAARCAERALRARGRPRDRAPAARLGEGLLLRHARGRDRHRERRLHARPVRAAARAAPRRAAARDRRPGAERGRRDPRAGAGGAAARRRATSRRRTTTTESEHGAEVGRVAGQVARKIVRLLERHGLAPDADPARADLLAGKCSPVEAQAAGMPGARARGGAAGDCSHPRTRRLFSPLWPLAAHFSGRTPACGRLRMGRKVQGRSEDAEALRVGSGDRAWGDGDGSDHAHVRREHLQRRPGVHTRRQHRPELRRRHRSARRSIRLVLGSSGSDGC